MIKWEPSNMFLAQAGHFLLGLVAVFAPMAIVARHPELAPWGVETLPSIATTVVVVLYAVVKEPFIDPKMENDPFLWGGFLDMVVIYLGLSIAWATLL